MTDAVKILKDWITESNNIVFFGGAGVSTESGIPDFRSTDGLYNQEYDYPPETILSHSFYEVNPEEFFRFYRNKMLYLDAQPNAAHKKLAEWEASHEEAEAVCDRMEELGYLNEAEYAGRIVRHFAAKGFGERKLRDELYRRGVPRELWDEALEQIEEEDNACAIDAFLEKKLKGSHDPKDVKRASDALARRGFRWPEIRDALRRYGMEVYD